MLLFRMFLFCSEFIVPHLHLEYGRLDIHSIEYRTIHLVNSHRIVISSRMVEAPLLVTVGTFFLCGAPSLALILCVLLPNSHLFVVSIIGAFMWCLAMMIAGIIWRAVIPLKDVTIWSMVLAVSAQEGMRLLLHRVFTLLSRHGDGAQVLLRPGAQNEIFSGLAIGTGYAFLSSMVNFFATVIDSFASNSAVYITKCRINFLVASASNALAFNILHICLGILVWPAYSDRTWIMNAVLAYLLHLGVAACTLISQINQGCTIALAVVFVLVFLVFGFTLYNCKRILEKEIDLRGRFSN